VVTCQTVVAAGVAVILACLLMEISGNFPVTRKYSLHKNSYYYQHICHTSVIIINHIH